VSSATVARAIRLGVVVWRRKVFAFEFKLQDLQYTQYSKKRRDKTRFFVNWRAKQTIIVFASAILRL
jgi:hypothetical protein